MSMETNTYVEFRVTSVNRVTSNAKKNFKPLIEIDL